MPPEPAIVLAILRRSLPLLGRTAALAAAGVGLGLTLNLAREAPLALTRYQPATTCELDSELEPMVAKPETISGLCTRGDVLVVDTRGADAYARGHLPEAAHLPCNATGPTADAWMDLTGGKQTVVVYGETTDEALEVARSLSSRGGALQAYVIEGGFEAWQAAALACASGACALCGEESDHGH